ncbi:unnamed protein product [Calicophoron daubneyi]|uniref:C2H2-type domain-containing protein n=1 Tax=Calicophoron daubneyi TaxID=300641 RepID=A0AAV2TQM6_CALDB
MEIEPNLYIWTGGGAQINTDTNAEQIKNLESYQETYPPDALSGIELELESDSECGAEADRHWNPNALNLMDEDLDDISSSSEAENDKSDEANEDATQTTTTEAPKKLAGVVASESSEVNSLVPEEKKIALENSSTDENNAVPSPLEANDGMGTSMSAPVSPSTEPLASSPHPRQDSPYSLHSHHSACQTKEDASHKIESEVTNSEHDEHGTEGNEELVHEDVVVQSHGTEKCLVCDRFFIDRRSRNIHMNKTHSIKSSRANQMSIRRGSQLPDKVNESEKDMTDVKEDSTEQHQEKQEQKEQNCASTISADCCPMKERSESTISDLELPTQPRVTRQKAAAKRRALSPNMKPAVLEPPTADNSTERKASSDTESGQSKKFVAYAVSPPLLSPAEGGLKIRLISLNSTKKAWQVAENQSRMASDSPEQGTGEFPASPTSKAESCATEELRVKTQPEEENNTSICGLSSADTGNKSDDGETETIRKQEPSPERPSQSFDCEHPPNRSAPPSPAPDSVTPDHPNSSAVKPSEKVNDEDVDITMRYYRVSKNSPRRPLMDTTLRTSDGLYKCRICRRVFSNRFSLTGHYKSHYNNTSTSCVAKPYHCQDCGQGYASTSGLHSHRVRNCPVLRIRTQKNKASASVNPQTARNSRSKPIKRSDTASKRKLIKTKQTETARKTQIGNSPNKVAGKSKREESTKEEVDIPDSTERDRSPIKPRKADTYDGLSKEPRIQQSVGVSEQPSIHSSPRVCKLRGGGGSGSHSDSKNSPGDKESTTAKQSDSNEETKIPQSWNQPNEESQTPDWLKMAYQQTAPTESSDSSQATWKIQLKQILEQACQSEEMRQRILTITSAALLAALSPMNSINAEPARTIPHSAHSAFTPINGNSTVPNSVNQFIPSVPEPVRVNSLKNDVDGNIPPTSAPLSPTGRPFYSLAYPCPYCRTEKQIFADAQALEKHIFLTHSSQFESLRVRQPSGPRVRCLSGDRHASTPDTACAHPLCCNSPTSERSTSSSANTFASDTSGVNVANYANLVKCPECERIFSTFAACRVHQTKAHQVPCSPAPPLPPPILPPVSRNRKQTPFVDPSCEAQAGPFWSRETSE